jgi:hypothetical protein
LLGKGWACATSTATPACAAIAITTAAPHQNAQLLLALFHNLFDFRNLWTIVTGTPPAIWPGVIVIAVIAPISAAAAPRASASRHVNSLFFFCCVVTGGFHQKIKVSPHEPGCAL